MLDEKLEQLQQKFAAQAGRVERMVEKAIKSLVDDNEELAKEVIKKDEREVNRAEIEIEQNATELIALYSPKASEMRRIIAIIKANGELERIGDQAVNISISALYLIPRVKVKPLIDLPRMAGIVKNMIHCSLEAFLSEKLEPANKALRDDKIVNEMEVQIIRELLTYMMEDPTTIERALKLIFITKNLERIGDLATNVSEDVVYYLTGEDIRHPRLKKEK
ncbi:MAG: phosphate signaling complex protein PhoU [Candidatus Zixiibacteriota bacterium]